MGMVRIIRSTTPDLQIDVQSLEPQRGAEALMSMLRLGRSTDCAFPPWSKPSTERHPDVK